MPSMNQTKSDQIYCFFSSHNTKMLHRHTILCNWLVCKRPLSPRFDRHTMSSFPMLVAPVRRRRSEVRLAWGARQYRNWRLAWGCSILTWPKTDSSFTVVFNAVTAIKAFSCHTDELKISWGSIEQVFDNTFLNFDLLLLLQNTLPFTVNHIMNIMRMISIYTQFTTIYEV